MPPLHWFLFCLWVIVIKPGFVHGQQSRRTGNNLDRRQKIPKVAQATVTVEFSDLPSGILESHFAESFHMSECSWMMDPTRSPEMSSCSAIDLAEIHWSSKISSWICSIISGVVTVFCRPERGASQVEKSPRLKWATQGWRWLTMVHVPLMFLSEWREFPLKPWSAGKENLMRDRARCSWNHARCLTYFLSASVTRKV